MYYNVTEVSCETIRRLSVLLKFMLRYGEIHEFLRGLLSQLCEQIDNTISYDP